MHPNISKYISETFYKSEIKDAVQIMDLIGEQEFYKELWFNPFIFFHIEVLFLIYFLIWDGKFI
jgi:hypothetical protein